MPGPTTCPRCGQADPGATSCPRCGVVFAKLRERRPPPADAPRTKGERSRPFVLPLLIAGGLLAVAISVYLLRPRAAARAEAAGQPLAVAVNVLDVPPPTLSVAPPVLPPLAPPAAITGMSDEDRRRADELSRRINAKAILTADDVQVADELAAHHPEEPALRNLLAAVLTLAGWQERGQRRLAEAARLLQRAATVAPDNVHVWLALLDVHLESSDWSTAENAARGALALDPRQADALRGLGYALLRQDRSREAAAALQAALDVRADSGTQALLERVRKSMADEKGMAEQQLSHFHVRYDGEEHADVGREILRALERHYATLVSSLDHQPSQPIPVILFSRQSYYDASGAPAWSGGNYDSLDGRIRIPIGGLTTSLGSGLDETLIHELTHAFIADRTRGAAPRDVHEGLAQYMEGKRLDQELTAGQLTAMADGRIKGVAAYYLSALSFVEFLIANRGLGGMNDLLRTMGETGNVDEAFRRVHGQTYSAVQQSWRERFTRQHGS